MDAVKAFNAELSALYEVRPPISKAKMTAITRGAIKAIKFYKHVVQSVEKFILKCKSEYKVPGLYVIDSIVRQSRHQFGDKDVFAPRFAKNMQQTFVNLFKCPAEDKSKIIRVLNLWQKNQVFAPEVIQPLFDLTDPNNPIHKELGTPMQSNGINQNAAKGSPALQKTPTKGSQPQGNEVAHGASNLNLTDPVILAQLQRLLQRGADNSGKADGQVHFDKKLLDYDYGDDDEEVNPSPRPPADSVSSLLANPEVIRHLQTIQQGMQSSHPDMDMDKMRKLQEMKQQEDEFEKHLAQTVPNLPFAAECDFKPGGNASVMGGYYLPPGQDLTLPPPGYKTAEYDMSQPNNVDYSGGNNTSGDVEVITLDHDDSRSVSPDDRYRDRRRRSRSRDKSRDRGRDRDRDRRRRSRDRSRSRGRRHRSRSRDRNRTKEKEKEKETEKDKERKKRGLPAIRKENLSVCSTTLWVGHLSKLVHQDDLSNTFGEFGDVVNIDLISPRGCAFIVMHRRQDAARCLNKLKNHVLHGKAITLAWAPGKGVKGKDLKDYWEGDLGVSYIPWSKLKPDIDLEMLEEGGMIDEDTMPEWMKNKMAAMSATRNPNAAYMALTDVTGANPAPTVDTSQPPPIPGAGLLQPSLTLSLMNPFQFNNRLLGPVGMNVTGMMPPNIPIGVPPPNMPTAAMMPNQLLGLGSPFQGPPGIMQQMMDGKASSQSSDSKGSLLNMTQPFGMVPQPPVGLPAPHDDNMDIEMEDAEKPEVKPLSLSEQLQASMNQFNRDGDKRDNGRDERGRRRSRSRDRDRDHNRDRERRGSRERDRERRDSRDTSRGGRGDGRRERRDDRRDRPNRWGDRDNGRRDNPGRENDIEGRRDREKTLNDRLQEMAGMPDRSNDRPGRERKVSESGSVKKFGQELAPPPDPALFMHGAGGPPGDFGPPSGADFGPAGPDYGMRGPPMRGPPIDDYPPDFNSRMNGPMMGPPDMMMDGPPDMMDGPPHLMDGPPHLMDGPPHLMDGPPHLMDGPPHLMDGPPHLLDGPPHLMDGPHMGLPHRMHHDDGFRRGGRRGDYRDEFESRMRGPPDFYPRDDYGPRGPPHMRGGPPDFGPRGPPMMRGDFGPRGPPRFGPRGPHMRARAPRFDSFGPRFDGPPDFYRGPGGPRGPPPPGMYDEPPHLMRHRGGPPFDDRRRSGRSDFHESDGPPVERPERRSRWGNDTPTADEVPVKQDAEEEQKDEGKGGNCTPLVDECPVPGEEPVSVPVVEEPPEECAPPAEPEAAPQEEPVEEKAE